MLNFSLKDLHSVHQFVELNFVFYYNLLLHLHVGCFARHFHTHPEILLLNHEVYALNPHQESEHCIVDHQWLTVKYDFKRPVALLKDIDVSLICDEHNFKDGNHLHGMRCWGSQDYWLNRLSISVEGQRNRSKIFCAVPIAWNLSSQFLQSSRERDHLVALSYHILIQHLAERIVLQRTSAYCDQLP